MTSMMSERNPDTCCGGGSTKEFATLPPHERRVCQCYASTCSNYLCAVCGVAVAWHEDLMIANPTISGRFCDNCVDIEADYHGLDIEEMRSCRARLRAKRIGRHSHQWPQDLTVTQSSEVIRSSEIATPIPRSRDVAFRPERIISPRSQDVAFRPERIVQPPSPQSSYLERGEACWCHRAKDCDGNHEFHNVSIVCI